MELELARTYLTNGTNGELSFEGKRICSTIELPWKKNLPRISCIPEGEYVLAKRYSRHFGWHLQVMDVKNRTFILIYPANDALKELKGCIAPVSILKGEGRGLRSRIAFEKLRAVVYASLQEENEVFLSIRCQLSI